MDCLGFRCTVSIFSWMFCALLLDDLDGFWDVLRVLKALWESDESKRKAIETV